MRLRGQAVKTSPFHGGNTGSIPVGVIKKCADVAQFLTIEEERVKCNQQVIGSSPIIGFFEGTRVLEQGPLAQLVRATGS